MFDVNRFIDKLFYSRNTLYLTLHKKRQLSKLIACNISDPYISKSSIEISKGVVRNSDALVDPCIINIKTLNSLDVIITNNEDFNSSLLCSQTENSILNLS